MNQKKRHIVSANHLDKKLVHKHKNENVFICNLRRSLPLTVDSNVFQNDILDKCTEQEKEIVNNCYIRNDKDGNSENFCLKGVEQSYSVRMTKKRLLDSSVSKKDMRFFLKFYRRDNAKSAYLLRDTPDEVEILRISRIMGVKKNLVPEQQKSVLSEVFDRLNIIGNESVFYANMLVDVNHSYFFEHPNDHVPGMLVVEAARQVVVSCTHKYGKVPFEGYKFILSNMGGKFKSYVELNYPVILKMIQTEVYGYDTGIWADSNFEIHIYQREIEAAVIIIHGNTITSSVFKRIRLSKGNINQKSWFILKTNIEYSAVLRDEGIKKIEARIEYISEHECIFLIESGMEKFRKKPELEKVEFFMYFSNIGFVHGIGGIKTKNQFGDFSQVHVRFVEMDKKDKSNLQEVIKRYGYLVED
ncbi:MAG: AfsA-related hotdog domain-containing protein [Leptospirales bacterium]